MSEELKPAAWASIDSQGCVNHIRDTRDGWATEPLFTRAQLDAALAAQRESHERALAVSIAEAQMTMRERIAFLVYGLRLSPACEEWENNFNAGIDAAYIAIKRDAAAIREAKCKN